MPPVVAATLFVVSITLRSTPTALLDGEPSSSRSWSGAALTAAATVLLLVGCSSAPDAALGESVETGLWSTPELDGGTVSITAESLERVSAETAARWRLGHPDEDAYLARFTVQVVEGAFEQPEDDRDTTLAFANGNWVVGTDDGLVRGPGRLAESLSGRSEELAEACPSSGVPIKAALAAGDVAEVCALLFAPAGATVTSVGYANASAQRTNRSAGGRTSVTWAVTSPDE